MKTLKEKLEFEAKQWSEVLTECVNLKGTDDYNDRYILEKVLLLALKSGADITKNHIKNTIDII